MSDEERKRIAGAITRGIYKGLEWDVDISNTLDEDMERVKMAHFLNGPTSEWIREQHPAYVWLPVIHDDFRVIQTVGNFAWLCFHHVQDVLRAKVQLSFDPVFELKGEDHVE